jgi:hypothetical protein
MPERSVLHCPGFLTAAASILRHAYGPSDLFGLRCTNVRGRQDCDIELTNRCSKEALVDDPSSGNGPGGPASPTGGPAPTGNPEKSGSVGKNAITDVELFKSVVEQYRFVTTMFWQQAGFFLLIQSGLLAVVAQWLPKGTAQFVPLVVVSIFGLFLAFFWAWVAWLRLGIVEYWRDSMVSLDNHRCSLYAKQYAKQPRRLDKYRLLAKYVLRRPTDVTGLLPYFMVLIWIALLIYIIVWLPTVNC